MSAARDGCTLTHPHRSPDLLKPMEAHLSEREFLDLVKMDEDNQRAIEDVINNTSCCSGLAVIINQKGPISAGTISDEFVHPTGGTAENVVVHLSTTGTSSTTVSVRKNGTEFAGFTLASGVATASLVVSEAFIAVTDELTVATPTGGSGARGLVVTVLFA